ncbi:hypothetical protein [Polyangium jinanense]|uniref:Uncharacterized protein n=1 Tax=Polyangium jinanense TaxID=2829994 RepID=A0A9X3WZA5_9BACT|nr:hypothetical protein [Polyangium jinanense]MDC3954519.1 hypothetical protein [Polyangium jinanense]MDC3980822.1 hypothetical protein [Polyangium jinanense]
MSANDDRDDRNEQSERARTHLVQGLGHLFRAATMAASGIKKELDRSDVGKQVEVAGREIYRAANNVVSRLGTEILFGSKDKDKKREPEPEDERKGDDRDPPRYPPGQKPKGPTEEDPGFRIMTDDDQPK